MNCLEPGEWIQYSLFQSTENVKPEGKIIQIKSIS